MKKIFVCLLALVVSLSLGTQPHAASSSPWQQPWLRARPLPQHPSTSRAFGAEDDADPGHSSLAPKQNISGAFLTP